MSKLHDNPFRPDYDNGAIESAATQEGRPVSTPDSQESSTVGSAFAAVPTFNLHSHHSTHDFRDVDGDLKRDPGREWERQQPEHTPGLGRR